MISHWPKEREGYSNSGYMISNDLISRKQKNINWSRIFILLRYIQLVFLGPKQRQVLEPKVHYFCFPTLETKQIAYF